MKVVVLASLLAVAGAAPLARFSAAQQSGGVQMQADEYAKYQTCVGGQAGAAQAAACQDYLKAYPNSAVKKDVLVTIMFDYSQTTDNKGLISASDAVIASDPNNLPAYVFETQAHKQSGDAAGAADFAKKGIALLDQGKPSGMTDTQFTAIKTNGYPLMYSAEANGAAAAGDQAGAIAAFKQELASVSVDQTTKTGLQLQDTYALATAYYKSTPPDYVNCAFYAARGMDYAPEPYKTTFGQLAKYCYQKFHGTTEGFDAVSTAAQTNLNPPADFSIKPAPKPEDYVVSLISTTPDLTTLAPSDREFVLQYGTALDPKTGTVDPATGKKDPSTQKTYAAEVFDAVKGKVAKFPNILVISATADKIMTAVSDDAVQNKTADFEWDLKTPLKTAPAANSKITMIGTYSSYTATGTPVVVSVMMTDASVDEPKKATAPVHHPTPARRPR